MTTILHRARDTGLVTVNNTLSRDTANTMTLSGAANQFNLEVNAYAGGIVGYNDAATRLTIRNATNGSDSNAASVGSLKMRGETGILGGGVSCRGTTQALTITIMLAVITPAVLWRAASSAV